jgi:fibronectin type 3 domain-containing protein
MKLPLPIVSVRISPEFAPTRSTLAVAFAHRALRAMSLATATVAILFCAACAGTIGNPGGGKTSIPATPAGLTATAGNSQITLNWSTTANATGYNVQRSTTTGGPYSQISSPSSTTFTDSGLTNGTKYFYVVSAFNSTGPSSNSAEVSATPTAPTPAVPSGLAATASNAKIILNWNASSGATSYNVKRSTSSGAEITIASPASVTTYTDAVVVNGTKYFYEVSAVNSSGESANSAEVNATPAAPQTSPPTPANLQGTAGNAQVTLTWSASTGATSYHVKRSTTSGAETQVSAPTTNNFTDSTVTNGTKYFYEVSAVNSIGESANSNEINATPAAPQTAPPSPANLQGTAGNAQVALTWSPSTGATTYHVKRSTTSGAESQIAAPATNNFTDTTVTNGTKYFYEISAVNSTGESANSNEIAATPAAPQTAPPTPANLQATGGNAQISLTWTASTGATKYNVKRSTTSGGPFTTTLASPTATNYTDTTVTNGTPYFYVVSAVNSTGESANSTQATATPAATVAVDVTITIDPTKTKSISPYIYGINFYSGVTGAPPQLTFDRAGGNRWTAYNWETNASNAGSDYLYENDDYLSSSTVPAEAVRTFIAGDQADNLASLITVQLQGLVSGDEAGPVSTTNPPDLSRFKTVVDKKSTVTSTPFTITPPTTDANVYMDEFVWALDQKFSGQNIFGANPTTHPTFVMLDNEPELWNSTHLEVQGSTPVSSDDYISKTVTLTKALKDQYPNMIIFGPAHYGFQGIYNWQGELSTTPTGANWFPDKYFAALSAASATYGKPLVDVYDFHWYAEEYDSNGTRSLDLTSTTLTAAQIQLIVQSPRNLWDTTFNDTTTNSNPWIYEELGNSPIALLGRLQSKINSEFPSIKISISEYESGGWNHIAGTVAQADNLGIFGAQGVFAANFWPPNGTYSYALAGFRAFRDFDNAGSNFGDTALQSTSSNVTNVVVYASTDTTTPGRTVFVAINRSASAQVVAINGQQLTGTATLFQVTAATAQTQSTVMPVAAGTMPASGSTLTLTLPALSVTTIDVQ